MMTMLPGATNEAIVTCSRIDQWLDGQRALADAIKARAFVPRDLSGCSLMGDNVTATVRPGKAA